MPTYLNRTDYERLVDALLHLPIDPITGKVEADAVKIVLGEVGDIWPESIEADAEAA